MTNKIKKPAKKVTVRMDSILPQVINAFELIQKKSSGCTYYTVNNYWKENFNIDILQKSDGTYMIFESEDELCLFKLKWS